MPTSSGDCQKGSITTFIALIGLGFLTIGIFAAKTLVKEGGRLLPRAQTEQTVTKNYLPIADSYVDQGNPSVNFGSGEYLLMSSRSGEIKDSYIKFLIDDIMGPVVKAELKLVTTDADRKNSPFVYLTDNNWKETLINYDNRPIAGIKVADSKPVDWKNVNIDLTGIIRTNGIYSFILSGGYNAITKFISKESVTNKPFLTISFLQPTPTLIPTDTLSPAPTSTLTPTPTISPTPTEVKPTVAVTTPTLALTPTAEIPSPTASLTQAATPTLTVTVTPTAEIAEPSPTPQSTVSPTLAPTITVTAAVSPTLFPIPGDANEDGFVDGADYFIWLANYGKKVNNGYRDGDFNSDGVVDGKDYIIWLSNYSPKPIARLTTIANALLI